MKHQALTLNLNSSQPGVGSLPSFLYFLHAIHPHDFRTMLSLSIHVSCIRNPCEGTKTSPQHKREAQRHPVQLWSHIINNFSSLVKKDKGGMICKENIGRIIQKSLQITYIFHCSYSSLQLSTTRFHTQSDLHGHNPHTTILITDLVCLSINTILSGIEDASGI